MRVSGAGGDTWESGSVGDLDKGSVRGGGVSFKDIEGGAESFRLFGLVDFAVKSEIDSFGRKRAAQPPCCALLEMSPSSLSRLLSLRGWLLPSPSSLMPSVVTSALFRRQGPSRGSHDTGGCR